MEIAGKNGNAIVVKLLLAAGADVNAGSGSILQSAVIKGFESVVELLLTAGANVNFSNRLLGYALQTAASNCSMEIVQLLLSLGADVNAHCGDIESPLVAAVRKGSVKVVILLLAAGANSVERESANAVATRKGYGEIVDMLEASSTGENRNPIPDVATTGNEQNQNPTPAASATGDKEVTWGTEALILGVLAVSLYFA